MFQYVMENKCIWQPESSIDLMLLPDNRIDNSVWKLCMTAILTYIIMLELVNHLINVI